jgi:lipopolysaccharide assembly protein A
MKFLRTLFWVVVAVSLAIFAVGNWNDVSINLWGNLQAEVKLPILLLLIFLIGFLPTYFIMRGRLWSVKRKLALAERPAVAPVPAPSAFGPRTDEELA